MIAVEYDRYGAASELVVRDVADLGALAPGTLRVRVAATSVNPKDSFVRKGRFAALMSPAFPKRVGYDWAGVVESVAEDVANVARGDHAFGMINGWAGGTCAETIDVLAKESAKLPPAIALEAAAAVPLAAQTSLQALVDLARVEPGMHVVVSGASGGVGHFAVQLAKALGARVTAVASAASRDFCFELGADAFVAYGDDPAFETAGTIDVLYDVFGNLTFDRFSQRLSESGIFISTVPNAATLAAVASTPDNAKRRARLVAVTSRTSDLERLTSMLESGALRASIDRTFTMREIAAAHAYIEQKHTRGKIVVT